MIRRVASALAAAFATLDRARGLFFPFGLFAVLAVGLHAGADRVDDHLALAFGWVDGVLDAAAAWGVEALLELFGASAGQTEAVTFWLQDLVNAEAEEDAARACALVLELWADLLVARAVFGGWRAQVPLRALGRSLLAAPTVRRLFFPLAALLAAAAGVVSVAREVQVGVFGALTGAAAADWSAPLAQAAGALALVLVGGRLGAGAVYATWRWADARGRRELTAGVARARTAGIAGASVLLFLAVLAVTEGVPVAGTLRALILPGGSG